MLKRNEQGFTLIELLIVIVIIGILAAVAIPRFQGVSDKAKVGAAKAELGNVRQGLIMYQADNDTSAFPASGDITNYSELYNVIYEYVQIGTETEANFTFDAYASAATDTFVLTAKAKDRARTVMTVTPGSITP